MRFRLIKRPVPPAACPPRRPRSQNAPRPAPPTSTTPMAGITGRRGAWKTCENDPTEESHPPDGR